MKVRNGRPSDYEKVKTVMNEWWGGRQVDHLQHELFFEHFTNTVFIAEDFSGKMIGFINGFYSQVDLSIAYVHFIGVDPSVRGRNIGKQLYQHFFDKCLSDGRKIVISCTSKINEPSILFHKKIGFNANVDHRGKIQFQKIL